MRTLMPVVVAVVAVCASCTPNPDKEQLGEWQFRDRDGKLWVLDNDHLYWASGEANGWGAKPVRWAGGRVLDWPRTSVIYPEGEPFLDEDGRHRVCVGFCVFHLQDSESGSTTWDYRDIICHQVME